MRLGADVIVFSRCTKSGYKLTHISFLLQTTFLSELKKCQFIGWFQWAYSIHWSPLLHFLGGNWPDRCYSSCGMLCDFVFIRTRQCVGTTFFVSDICLLFLGGLQMQSIKRTNYTIGATWFRALLLKFVSVVEMVPFCNRRRVIAECMIIHSMSRDTIFNLLQENMTLLNWLT